ncbi:hypothetical protein [Antrihabitans sp. YC2-6]|uniref:hypothetical protein n=1 Tax=Antrihabitans sp. YC2-6 TaxID=2799498 RepID=UPI0018F7AEE2|nr:hypothetical protein [Antrihabitans sp. YC2-6]MBJ8347084.1 hypothetical protein [Antrihabitans sp. YC2-6]
MAADDFSAPDLTVLESGYDDSTSGEHTWTLYAASWPVFDLTEWALLQARAIGAPGDSVVEDRAHGRAEVRRAPARGSGVISFAVGTQPPRPTSRSIPSGNQSFMLHDVFRPGVFGAQTAPTWSAVYRSPIFVVAFALVAVGLVGIGSQRTADGPQWWLLGLIGCVAVTVAGLGSSIATVYHQENRKDRWYVFGVHAGTLAVVSIALAVALVVAAQRAHGFLETVKGFCFLFGFTMLPVGLLLMFVLGVVGGASTPRGRGNLIQGGHPLQSRTTRP